MGMILLTKCMGSRIIASGSGLSHERASSAGGETGVVEDELDVGGEGVAAGEFLDAGQKVSSN